MNPELMLNPSISPIYITATNMIVPIASSQLFQCIIDKIIIASLQIIIIFIIGIQIVYNLYKLYKIIQK